MQLAQHRYSAEGDARVRRLLLKRAEELVREIDMPEAERHYLRGSIRSLKEMYSEAIEDYSRAVTLQPDEVGWRYEFAMLLRRQGCLEEARTQAKWCARLAPRQEKYRKLLQEINQAQLVKQGRPKNG